MATSLAIVMPCCNSEVISIHLDEVASHVAQSAHAVVPLDQPGWDGAAELFVPRNSTLVPLPPWCPEFNPVEILWQFLRDNRLSSRIFQSNEDIVDQRGFAWNTLIDQPWRIIVDCH